MWEQEIVAFFQVPSWYSFKGTEENHKRLSQDSQSPVQFKLNWRVTKRPCHSVH